MNVWCGLKTTISRAGTALNAVGLSPQFAWTLQLRFWRSTALPKRDLRGTIVFQPRPPLRIRLTQLVRINPMRQSTAALRRLCTKEKPAPTHLFPSNATKNPRLKARTIPDPSTQHLKPSPSLQSHDPIQQASVQPRKQFSRKKRECSAGCGQA